MNSCCDGEPDRPEAALIANGAPGHSARQSDLGWISPVRGVAILGVVLWHLCQLPWATCVVHVYQKFILPYWYLPSVRGLFQFENGLQVLLAPLGTFCNLGYQGVHLFFILSGFGAVVSLKRLAESDPEATHRTIWRAWYARRIVKVVLPLWIALGMILTVLFWRGQEGLYDGHWLSPNPARWIVLALETAVGLAGIMPQTIHSIAIPFWFISPLFQFYLLFPLAYWCLKRFGRLPFMSGAIVVTIVSRAVGIFVLYHAHAWFAFGAFCGSRAAEFCLGLILADYYFERGQCWAPTKRVLWTCAATYIAGLMAAGSYIGAVVCDMLIGGSLFVLLYAIAVKRRWSWLSKLGTYSYGIFLLHYPLSYLLSRIFWGNIPWRFSCYPVVFVLVASYACLIGALYEWAWQRWLQRGTPRGGEPAGLRRALVGAGSVLAVLMLVLVCLQARGWVKAQEMASSAGKGDVQAQVKLARMYWDGDVGVGKNKEKGIALARQAAESGDSWAKVFLGWMYRSGENKDLAQSFRWYLDAAQQGDACGEYYAGLSYELGWGVSSNNAEAEKWYRAAAKQDHEGARAALRRLRSKTRP